jgi:6-methylsalicylate decarboxylase
VILLGNYAEKYLGDTAFEPVWAELDRRRAVVFASRAAAASGGWRRRPAR